MTDNENTVPPAGAGNPAEAPDLSQLPQFRVLGQYVKDLSFENPGAPNSLRPTGEGPKTDIGIDVQARRREGEEDQYEADLKLNISAKRGDEVLFIIELVYGGVFLLKNIPPESLQPALLIECPRLLFPFARQIVADVSKDGGFPPIMLDPIDFAALYRQQLEAAQKQATDQANPVN